jgi:hypothetical protein
MKGIEDEWEGLNPHMICKGFNPAHSFPFHMWSGTTEHSLTWIVGYWEFKLIYRLGFQSPFLTRLFSQKKNPVRLQYRAASMFSIINEKKCHVNDPHEKFN